MGYGATAPSRVANKDAERGGRQGGGGERGKKAHRNSDTPAGLKIAPRITTASQIVIVVGRHLGSLHDTRDGNQRRTTPPTPAPSLLPPAARYPLRLRGVFGE